MRSVAEIKILSLLWATGHPPQSFRCGALSRRTRVPCAVKMTVFDDDERLGVFSRAPSPTQVVRGEAVESPRSWLATPLSSTTIPLGTRGTGFPVNAYVSPLQRDRSEDRRVRRHRRGTGRVPGPPSLCREIRCMRRCKAMPQRLPQPAIVVVMAHAETRLLEGGTLFEFARRKYSAAASRAVGIADL
jgi:hypothetical protein